MSPNIPIQYFWKITKENNTYFIIFID